MFLIIVKDSVRPMPMPIIGIGRYLGYRPNIGIGRYFSNIGQRPIPMFFSDFDGLSGQFQKLKSKKDSKNCAKLLKTTRGTWKILRNQHIVSKSCEIMPHFWKMWFFLAFLWFHFDIGIGIGIGRYLSHRHRYRPIPMFSNIVRSLEMIIISSMMCHRKSFDHRVWKSL